MLNIRYFLFDEDAPNDDSLLLHASGYGDIVECTQLEWEACPHDWPITYERHTIFSNGVSQICLTKAPDF